MIICNAGLSALLDNVRRAWTQLSSFEFAMVLLHVALTVTTDLLSAVILGLLFTAASFIVEYSRHSGVLQRATLQLERSKVLRPAADHAAIDAHGAAVFIVHLHGMIFFGSANSVVEAVTLYLPYICPTSALHLPYICPLSGARPRAPSRNGGAAKAALAAARLRPLLRHRLLRGLGALPVLPPRAARAGRAG